MSKNKSVRQELERLYGKECFIDKLHLREETQKRYTGKGQFKRMKQLTYHHIKMRKDGGKATIENGALLSTENHAWFHKQTPEKQTEMNKAFQQYKMTMAIVTTARVQQAREIEFDMSDCITIPLEKKSRNNKATQSKRKTRIKERNGGNRTMKKKDIIDVIVIALFIIILAVYDVYISADNELKSNKINELTNKVEQQTELIDALQQ